jgi:hypothetical protein
VQVVENCVFYLGRKRADEVIGIRKKVEINENPQQGVVSVASGERSRVGDVSIADERVIWISV